MVKVEITEKMKAWARKKTDNHIKGPRFDPKLGNKRDIYNGYLGEAVFYSEHRDFKHVDTSRIDFIKGHIMIDVKTHARTVRPRKNFSFLLTDVDQVRYQKGIIYCHVSLLAKENLAFIVGYIDSKRARKVAGFREKGWPQMNNPGFTYSCDCWEIPFEELKDSYENNT